MPAQLALDLAPEAPRRRRAGARSSFHVRSHVTAQDAAAGEERARLQDSRVLNLFREVAKDADAEDPTAGKRLTPSQVLVSWGIRLRRPGASDHVYPTRHHEPDGARAARPLRRGPAARAARCDGIDVGARVRGVPPQPRPPKPDRDRARFDNLVEFVGTVTKCECGKKGYLAKVSVRAEPLLRKRKYSARWDHPDPGDPDCSSLCTYTWP